MIGTYWNYAYNYTETVPVGISYQQRLVLCDNIKCVCSDHREHMRPDTLLAVSLHKVPVYIYSVLNSNFYS